jgi:competence protein ComEA
MQVPVLVTSPPSELGASWPRSAQWTVAVLLMAVLLFFGTHLWGGGSRPTQPDESTLRLDINVADSKELMELPGVGPALAERIVAHRQKHGPFKNVDELTKVAGLGPAKLARLRAHVVVGDTSPSRNTTRSPEPAGSNAAVKPRTKSKKEEALAGKTINVNQADLVELQKLPGVGPKIAQNLLNERARRAFATVQDLRRVSGIGPKTLEKIRPYVGLSDDKVQAVASR